MMSLNERHNGIAEPDILQLNMEIISKELNDLIVTEDCDFGIAQQFSVTTVKTTVQHARGADPHSTHHYERPPTYITKACYGPQQFYGVPGITNFEFNTNNHQMLQQPVSFVHSPYSDRNSNFSNLRNDINSNQVLNGSISRPTQDSFSNVTATPTYEFHYLRSRGEKDNKLNNSLPSSASGQGAFRKINKHYQKHVYQKIPNASGNNERVQFDLSALPPLDNDKSTSNVRRIFNLLHDLYLAIAETPVSLEEDSASQFEETFLSLPSKKTVMPSTLSVQNQVKQACRKLTIFIYEMQHIVSVNKVHDGVMHAECEFYLQQLQQYLNQLEMYKGIVMEHRHGKFLREEVDAHAERLSLLLEHTNRQIREVHIRILAADWYIGVKYRSDIRLSDQQFYPEVIKKSRIGVINEILQMCNTATAESESLNCNTATATQAFQPEKTYFTSGKQLLFNKAVANVKPPLIRNNNIFNIYKPIQTKRSAAAAAATGSQHARQPVFYIG